MIPSRVDGMGNRPVAVRARGWGWRHAGRRRWAVRDLDLDIAPGEHVLLLGASGAGKSTLLAGMAGLLAPATSATEGSGDQEGLLLLDRQPAVQARQSGAVRTGLLLQDPMAQTVLARCGDDVAFGLENHAVPADRIWPRVREAMRAVGLPHPLHHPTAQLSGGERQRLALAGVLVLRPGLLLLDEPTAMLDPQGAAALRHHVAQMLRDSAATCVLVEHRIGPWTDLVDRVVVLDPGGGVRADGPPGRVLRGQGAALAAEGVWVPDHPPRPRRRRSRPEQGAEVLVRARALAAALPGAPPAFRGLDLCLRAGHAVCATGPNGSGKSTLALALGGLTRPVAGSIEAGDALASGAGTAPYRWRPRQLVTRIGSVFQEPAHQFVAATVADDLAVGPRRLRLPRAEVDARVGELLARLRLDHLARANPFTLSGGEQRRLSVATALATRPRVLVLDEPTFGQDSRTWAELVDLLGEVLEDGAGLLVVTHDELLVSALADEVVALDRADVAGAAVR